MIAPEDHAALRRARQRVALVAQVAPPPRPLPQRSPLHIEDSPTAPVPTAPMTRPIPAKPESRTAKPAPRRQSHRWNAAALFLVFAVVVAVLAYGIPTYVAWAQ